MFERFKCVRVSHHTGRFVRVPTLLCTSVSDGVAQKGNSCPYRYSADDGCTAGDSSGRPSAMAMNPSEDTHQEAELTV